MHWVLVLQEDFRSEKPLIQSIIENAGHVCLFLPRFHCELNPIEMLWGYGKYRMQISLLHVKHRGRSRRSPRDTKLRKGARIGPRCVGLALIRPRAGATVSGGATLSRKRWATRPVLRRCARLATPYLRPHWTSEGSPEFAKSADACGTLGNAKVELH